MQLMESILEVVFVLKNVSFLSYVQHLNSYYFVFSSLMHYLL